MMRKQEVYEKRTKWMKVVLLFVNRMCPLFSSRSWVLVKPYLLTVRLNALLSIVDRQLIIPARYPVPYVIPFESRVAIFRQRIANEREQLWMDGHRFNRPRHRAVVRRQHLSEDAYATLNGLGAGLKSKIEIVFVDEHGMEEQGIDGGGLFKELLTRCVPLL